MTGRDNSPRNGEIYLEFRQVGRQMQCVAIDATTGVEASVFGPATVPQKELQRLAVRKLQRRMDQENAAKAPPPGNGKLV